MTGLKETPPCVSTVLQSGPRGSPLHGALAPWHPQVPRGQGSPARGDAELSGDVLSSLLCLAPAGNQQTPCQLQGSFFYRSGTCAQDSAGQPVGPWQQLLLQEGWGKWG